MTELSRNAKRVVVAALLGIFAPLSLPAQGNLVACAAAQDSLAAGAFLWSGVLELGQCGASGAITLASLVTQSASAQLDSSQRFDRLIGLATRIVSPTVVNAAISVAQGTGNTQIARVTALQVMLAEFNNAEGLGPADPGQPLEACALATGGPGRDPAYRAPLPPTTLQQMMSAASALYHNAADDPVVRSAAYCLRSALHIVTPFPVNTGRITLSYVCGDQFKVHNTNPEAVPLSWNSYHVPPNARTPAPTLTNGQILAPPNGDVLFRTDSIATARLYYRSALIQTRANGGITTCP